MVIHLQLQWNFVHALFQYSLYALFSDIMHYALLHHQEAETHSQAFTVYTVWAQEVQ